ncbi:unnamed protein product [Nyctereutes procyonoides]|uniref:(raccoon dog) hypothetical protein n=1 Tax=Nyctereutes procyonoides TaxID=34880 RepID=A0A811YNU3_NYCPR|nr:unnamed protein product [Nyctereutes procyonoides]
MTQESLHLLLVLLLLALDKGQGEESGSRETGKGREGDLFSGSWVQTQENELVWAAQGQVVSVKCPSAPLAGEYKNKTWCKETKPGYCLKLPSIFIWDNPSAGFFIVIITEIKKISSGIYWCRIDRGPKGSIYILKNISLVVTSMITSSTFISSSKHCLPDSAFMMLLCAFLETKILALTALLLFLTYRTQVSTSTMGGAAKTAPSPKTPGPLGIPR